MRPASGFLVRREPASGTYDSVPCFNPHSPHPPADSAAGGQRACGSPEARAQRAMKRPPPHGHAAWRGARSAGAAFSAQNASGSECRQSRSSVFRRSRKKGSGDPAVDTYCLRPVRNTGCLCGNIRCRPCRRKGTRHAQSRQHNSATERFLKGELSNHKGIFDELHIRHPFCSDRKFTLFFQSGRLEKI